MDVEYRGAVDIRPGRVDGIEVSELSALGWDADAGMLYAITNIGGLLHLAPEFEGGNLVGVEVVSGFALRDESGRPLAGDDADAEGLSVTDERDGVRDNARLAVSFERHPRVVVFDRRGGPVGRLTLPAGLRSAKAYRSRNRGLEAITRHPSLGWLVGPESPLRGEALITIHGLAGGRLGFPGYSAHGCGLVAMEAMPDGSLVTLERCLHRAAATVVIALRQSTPLEGFGRDLVLRPLAVFDSYGDWRVDNFEGLARHEDDRLFIVSDDNRHFLQRTLLVYLGLPRDRP